MEFFNSAVDVLKTLVVALGAGLGVWGAVNLMEGYGGDNPSAKSQGMKQLMAGGGVALIGITLIPLLSGLFGSKLRAASAAHTYCSNSPWLTVLVLVERIFKPYVLSKRRCFYEFFDEPHLCSQPAQDPHQPFLLRWWR